VGQPVRDTGLSLETSNTVNATKKNIRAVGKTGASLIGGVAPGVYVAENCGATLVAIPRVMLAKGGISVPVARGGCVAVRVEKRR